MGVKRQWILAVAALAAIRVAHPADSDPGLEQITVVATGISNMTAASAGDISQEEMLSQPLLRPAAVLENVPGLIVTQQSGEGKAIRHGHPIDVQIETSRKVYFMHPVQ